PSNVKPDILLASLFVPANCYRDSEPNHCVLGRGDEALCSTCPTAMPEQPLLPRLPCLTHWARNPTITGPDGMGLCEPTIPPHESSCPIGQAQFWGTASCAPVGRECDGEFAPDAASFGSPVLYVRASSTSGGDGSMAMPFDTIFNALEHATPGA